ncbi:putative ABC transport system permease protein [Acetoanaerobium pronyense]|uniref:ABC transport system permease protein n=1 Tax=Acetoanaerobium pronyense TaxID=1482736 RepID=A0ABS4KKS0_9FIRM|nr:FtsX-like permease family protein [Acetoanaerobium pronyense]MBP2028378.1 putative ABC transport system permease protein [Acetoanaerobium pronyense]
MNWLIIKNDFKRNKVINLALLLFIIFSASLAVLSVIVAMQTFTSISALYEKAQPPHFLQMHKGEINEEEINQFMSNYEAVTYWQTVAMINIHGENLTVKGNEEAYNLSDSRLGIGFVKQNESKDLLLNNKHEKVILNKGEIGIPVLLKEIYDMKIGDDVILNYNNNQEKFIIKEFILDSQMNSPMVSSTRILLSNEDFDILKDKAGENEYLVEAYFSNPKDAKDFQTSYENQGLPQSGQAVTYAMIFLLSALTDITTLFVLLLVSMILIIVSFICIKFTIMAALEEEIGEIGTMKAIGLSFDDISDIYLNKYKILAMFGVIIGYILALSTSGIFTNHISTTFGNMSILPITIISSLFVGLIIFLLINYYCKRVLKKIKKITVVDALVRGKGFDKEKSYIKDGLYKSKKLAVNSLMAIREVFYKFKNWIIVCTVVSVAVLMIMIPFNLMNTFEAPEFITYMGSSREDILIQVENGEQLETNYKKVMQLLESDNTIESYYEYKRVRIQTTNSAGELMNIHVDSGYNSGNDLKYISGNSPDGENEIAISYLNANEMEKSTGDKILLFYNEKEKEVVISGIYQDVTSGGYTAKSKYDFSEVASENYSFSVNLKDNIEILKVADYWTEIIGPGETIGPMEEFLNQTLGGVVNQLRNIVFIIILLGSCLVMLITFLFLKLRLAKDLSEIAILKAIGFSERDIKKQYLIKTGYISAIGVLVGIILTNALGEKVISLALSISGLGVKHVELTINSLVQYIMLPSLLLSLILLTAYIVLRDVKKYNIISIINE